MRRRVAWNRRNAGRLSDPRLISRPPGSHVLVLSPHPDDDAIGPGGTLVKQHEAGCTLTSLVLTDVDHVRDYLALWRQACRE